VADNWESGRKYQIGDKIFEGATVLQLPDLRTLQVAARVHDTDLLRLSRGLPAEVVLDAIPDRPFRGRVIQLSEAASTRNRQSQLRTFLMKVALERPDPAVMKPGMTARVQVPVSEPDVLVVPRAALHTGSRGDVFLLRQGPPAQRVPVEVLDANAREAVIRGDIRPGEAVLPADGAAGPAAAAAVDWLMVKREDFAFTVAGSGQVAAEKSVDIGPPALPRVWRYKIIRIADEGIAVRPGDFLVQFDPTEIHRYLRDETAELDKARQEILRIGSTRESAVKDLELELEEAKTQEVKAQSKLLDVREFESSLKVREAEFELELAQARTRMLGKKLDAVRENARLETGLLKGKERFHQERVQSYQQALTALEVKAPIDGVVIFKTGWNNEKKQVGSDVFMMESIISLPDLATLMVRGQVAEVDSNKIRPGLPVTVTFDGIPEKVFPGRIDRIADSLTAGPQDRPIKSLEFTVRLEQPDPLRMRPGMAARLEVEIDHFQDVLAVPLAALETAGGRSFLWVERDGRPERREVTVGRNNGLMAIVTAGLKEGERVASRPMEPGSTGSGNGSANGRARS
jgi:HlyD family secretion protein